MASVEIDESELSALHRAAGVAERLAPRPRTRSLLERAVAVPEPSPPTALENGANADDALSALMPMIEQIRKLEGRLATSGRPRPAVLPEATAAGYTTEGIEQLQRFMSARNITDPAQAIREFERENPQPEPIMTGGVRAPWQARLGAASEIDRESEQISLKPLLEGNDEGFLSGAIAIALRDARK